jgi:hypothetical protein
MKSQPNSSSQIHPAENAWISCLLRRYDEDVVLMGEMEKRSSAALWEECLMIIYPFIKDGFMIIYPP